MTPLRAVALADPDLRGALIKSARRLGLVAQREEGRAPDSSTCAESVRDHSLSCPLVAVLLRNWLGHVCLTSVYELMGVDLLTC